jgi:predicted kinase
VIEARAARGVPCDTHGDLHLSHVHLFPDRPPPDDLVIIDCVEFAERFRFADPIADIAFLVMDLAYHGRRDLAAACADAYLAAASSLESRLQPAGDSPPGATGSPAKAGTPTSAPEEGRRLLPFYVAYRAVVRAKVKGMGAQEAEVAEVQRNWMRMEAQAHWLFALGTLEEPAKRPALVLVGGLPGTGKSTLARGLAAAANFTVVRSDEVRKELAGVPRHERAAGFYTPEWTERVYSECLKRAGDILRDGGRAIVDASFATDQHRRTFLTTARQLGVPAVLLVCRAPEELVRERLRLRRGDVSDAGWEVFEGMRDRWDDLSAETKRRALEIDTTEATRAVRAAVEVLRERGLS